MNGGNERRNGWSHVSDEETRSTAVKKEKELQRASCWIVKERGEAVFAAGSDGKEDGKVELSDTMERAKRFDKIGEAMECAERAWHSEGKRFSIVPLYEDESNVQKGSGQTEKWY